MEVLKLQIYEGIRSMSFPKLFSVVQNYKYRKDLRFWRAIPNVTFLFSSFEVLGKFFLYAALFMQVMQLK